MRSITGCESAVGFGADQRDKMLKSPVTPGCRARAGSHGQRGKPAAHRGGRGALLLAHDSLPRDHRPVVHLAELVGRGDAERPHEVRHVEPVGAAGAGALLASEPDLLFGDRCQVGQAGELAGAGGRDGEGGGRFHLLTPTTSLARDRPDYHVLIGRASAGRATEALARDLGNRRHLDDQVGTVEAHHLHGHGHRERGLKELRPDVAGGHVPFNDLIITPDLYRLTSSLVIVIAMLSNPIHEEEGRLSHCGGKRRMYIA